MRYKKYRIKEMNRGIIELRSDTSSYICATHIYTHYLSHFAKNDHAGQLYPAATVNAAAPVACHPSSEQSFILGIDAVLLM